MALLPGLDSTPMGWQRRDWYLGEHADPAVRPDRQRRRRPCGGTAGSSAAGPRTATARSCAGSWRTPGADAVAAADAAAARLTAVVGPVRLTARTRGMTWLEQELAD